MSTKPKDGGPAFPGFSFTDGRGNQRRNEHSGEWETHEGGMTLRDWFAGQALSPTLIQAYGSTPETLARKAYEIAQAMVDERNKYCP